MHFLDRYTIVHNGEIYNYIELKEELSKKGYNFHSQSDTEVILAAYNEWKQDCLQQFDGMFSFAIWDEQDEVLFAARDRMGEKPFYYCLDGLSIIFGSEMKAIWAAGVERQPNLKMLFNFITIGYTDNPSQPGETFFENIQRLPPASYLTYNPAENKIDIKKYWEIDPDDQDLAITDAEATEKFLYLLRSSVKRRLRSDVAIGTSLSGGLDSSSIAALSNEFKTQQQSYKCFTASFPGFEKDETEQAVNAAKHLGLQPFTVSVTPEGLLKDWDQLVHHQEEPFTSASIYAQYKVYQLANEQNVKVLLDGQGADELLAGYHKYYKWYWQELFHKRKLLGSKEIKAAHSIGITEKFGIKNILASLFPDIATVILEKQYLLKAIQQEDLDRDFVRLQSREAYYSTPEIFNLNGVLHFNCFEHGLEELLRYADRNSMAHGREIRLPFLSHELVEFVFTLPSNFKIRKGWTKWILRESLKGHLPEQITWRKDKVGFEPPQKQWMQNDELQEMIREAKKELADLKILKPSAVDKKIIPRSAHETDNYDWRYLSASILFK
jgi:asparagine synthase (glutamine-hydrolysing)